jgi:hypothetical protein
MADEETGEYERYVRDKGTGRFKIGADKRLVLEKGKANIRIEYLGQPP